MYFNLFIRRNKINENSKFITWKRILETLMIRKLYAIRMIENLEFKIVLIAEQNNQKSLEHFMISQ